MLRKNVASQVVTFNLINATTGAALTGATVTVKYTLDGTQGSGGGTVTELGTGQYKYVPAQAETNGTSVGFSFTATNAVPVNLHCFTIGQDPTQTTWQVNVASITAGAIAAASFAANALDAVWSTATRVLTAGTNLNNISAADVWASATRLLTAGTNIVLAKGVGVTGFNDPTVGAIADQVWDEVNSDHLTAGTTGKALSNAGALGSPLDAAGVRAALGMASANMDTQLSGISTKTTNLPSDPADESLIIAATDAIIAKLPAALVGGRMDVSVGAMAADVFTSSALSAAAANEIADALLLRGTSNVEASVTAGAKKTLAAFIMLALHKNEDLGTGVIRTYQSDGTTASFDRSYTEDASLNPIKEIDGAA